LGSSAQSRPIKQTLQHEVPGIVPVNATGSKRSRVEAITPVLMANNVYLPENPNGTKPEWVRSFISECSAFPKGANDDQVDTMTQALNFLTPAGWTSHRRALEAAKAEKPIHPQDLQRTRFNDYFKRVLDKAANRINNTYPSRRPW
jgi:hypothetical protein